MKTLLFSLAFMLSMVACSTGSRDANFESPSRTAAPAMDESQGSDGNYRSDPGTVQVENQKIIRNGNMSISVKNALETRNALNAILEKHKAYVGNEHLNNSDYQTVYTIQIRIPAANLDGLVKELEALDGTVTFKSIEARDVTEEYIDLETRLANKRAYVEQYKALLKNAKTIEDILKVREQIRVLEEEIESATGRLKYLTNQVDLSTLDLTITETKDFVYRAEKRINFFERLKQSLSGGWYAFVNFVIYLVVLWPFWILLALGLWGYRRWYKHKKQRTTVQPPRIS